MNASIASVRLVVTEDSDPDLSWLEPDSGRYEGCTPAERATYLAQDAERLASYGDSWSSVGISAVATIRFTEDQSVWSVGSEVSTAGLWGIESDSGADEFDEVGSDQLSDLRAMLSALGFSASAIDDAFSSVEKNWS